MSVAILSGQVTISQGSVALKPHTVRKFKGLLPQHTGKLSGIMLGGGNSDRGELHASQLEIKIGSIT